MKDTIDNWDLLIIRAIKKHNKYEMIIKFIKNILARRQWISKCYVDNHFMSHYLLNICIDYNLICNLHEFIYKDLNPKKWWTKEVKSYEDNLIHELIGVIAVSEVSKFPRYPRPAWFRNKYPLIKTEI
jgi:hypothetical protein